ncbi:MAG TPA: hypothetical protein VFC79_08990, partial [Tissierellaceae bacterium]|nr:hypothetical protein [Tissierellaceae bacterium]
ITGLWEGVINMKDTAVRKVKEVGTGMINGIKGIFKSSSPSKVFHEIGEDLMKGLDNGIELAKKLPEGTLSELAKKLLGDIEELANKLNREMKDIARDVGSFDIFGSGMSNIGSRDNDTKDNHDLNTVDDSGRPTSSWKLNPETNEYEKTRNLSVGMSYVPYDNFPANLHKGEAVLTKEENKEYKKGKVGNNYGDIYVTIPAKDIKEMKDVTDFFNKIGQVAKAGVING